MGSEYTTEMGKRLSALLARSRTQSGLSRRRISEAVNVSESTVKMWETGLGSPGLSSILYWLRATGETSFRNMLEFFWPEHFSTPVLKKNDEEVREAVTAYLNHVSSPLEIRKLHYLIFGEYREQRDGIFNLFCAYVRSDAAARHEIDRTVQCAYGIADATKTTFTVPEIKAAPWILQEAAKARELSANDGTVENFLFHIDPEGISSAMMRAARLDAGATHRFLAGAMDKTERTIHNWEHRSEPSFLDLCNWFRILNKPLWNYFRAQMNPEDPLEFTERDNFLRDEIIYSLSEMNPEMVRRLAYLILGDHGCYWYSVLELMFEFACTPLPQRILLANAILMAYRLGKRNDFLPDDPVNPDLSFLEECIDAAMRAAGRPIGSPL